MDNLNKITIIIIRMQSLAFILVGLIYWCIVAGTIAVESLGKDMGRISYAHYSIIAGCHLLFGVILYARSRSLAGFFIRSVEND